MCSVQLCLPPEAVPPDCRHAVRCESASLCFLLVNGINIQGTVWNAVVRAAGGLAPHLRDVCGSLLARRQPYRTTAHTIGSEETCAILVLVSSRPSNTGADR